jgi:hypothetical protein
VFANAADINLPQGGTLELNYTDTPDRVRSLTINGMAKAPGTYGAPGSGATNIISGFFLGTGTLLVDPSAPPDDNFGNVIDDFEVDEGHFSWPYNFSPISQTFGLAAGTTIDRVTTQHQGEGAASQLLNLVASGTNWQLRHNSGIGQAANPAGNTSLEAIGSIGFWLKTDDPGITVRMGIDDPVGGNTALERGTALNVIADNQWHLYQWDFEDESQWDPFSGGANGVIDAPTGFVTIDSIWFAGIGNAQIYLDTVSHNPDGTIGFAQSMSGDLNGDGTVNLADYLAWRRGFGTIYTMADYENWRANFGANIGSGSASHAAVPEPSALLLLLSAMLLRAAVRRSVRP